MREEYKCQNMSLWVDNIRIHVHINKVKAYSSNDRELDRKHKSWEVLRNDKCIETQRIAFICPIKYKEISPKKNG